MLRSNSVGATFRFATASDFVDQAHDRRGCSRRSSPRAPSRRAVTASWTQPVETGVATAPTATNIEDASATRARSTSRARTRSRTTAVAHLNPEASGGDRGSDGGGAGERRTTGCKNRDGSSPRAGPSMPAETCSSDHADDMGGSGSPPSYADLERGCVREDGCQIVLTPRQSERCPLGCPTRTPTSPSASAGHRHRAGASTSRRGDRRRLDAASMSRVTANGRSRPATFNGERPLDPCLRPRRCQVDLEHRVELAEVDAGEHGVRLRRRPQRRHEHLRPRLIRLPPGSGT